MILKPPGGSEDEITKRRTFSRKRQNEIFFFAQTQNDKYTESDSLRIYGKKCIGNVVNRTEEVSEYDREILKKHGMLWH